MKRLPVSSSDIAGVGYDSETSTLEIEFHDGSIYKYTGVPEAHFEGLLAAGSVGKYFHRHVKGFYRYRQVS